MSAGIAVVFAFSKTWLATFGRPDTPPDWDVDDDEGRDAELVVGFIDPENGLPVVGLLRLPGCGPFSRLLAVASSDDEVRTTLDGFGLTAEIVPGSV
jgi:hypothetical protein